MRVAVVLCKEDVFKENKDDFFSVIEDIIKINNALNKSLYAGPLVNPDAGIHNDKSIYKLAPGTVTLFLKYDYNDLMSVGELNFEEFLDNYDQQTTCLIIYNCNGVVKSLIITENLITILNSLDGRLSIKNICDNESEDNCIEIREFLDYAVAEQIVQMC